MSHWYIYFMKRSASLSLTAVEKEVARLLYASAQKSTQARSTARPNKVSSLPSGSRGVLRSHVEVEMSPGLEVMGMCRNFFEPFVSAAWVARVESRLRAACAGASRTSSLIIDHYLSRSESTHRWLCKILPGYDGASCKARTGVAKCSEHTSVRVRETVRLRAEAGRSCVQVEVQTKEPVGHVTFALARTRNQRATFHSTSPGVIGLQPGDSADRSAYGMRIRSNFESSWSAWKRATPLPLNGVIIANAKHARLTLRTTYELPNGMRACFPGAFEEARRVSDDSEKRPTKIDVCRVWEGSTLRSAQACMERGEAPSVAVELEYVRPPVPGSRPRSPRCPLLGTRQTRREIPNDMDSWVRTARGVLSDAGALFALGAPSVSKTKKTTVASKPRPKTDGGISDERCAPPSVL